MSLQENYLELYWEYLMAVQGASQNTLESYKFALEPFAKAMPKLEQINQQDIVKYINVLVGEGVTRKTQAARLTAIRSFFKFMIKRKFIADNPTQNIELPKIDKDLPKPLSHKEVNDLLKVCSENTKENIRLKAIIELFYATGLRISELAALKLSDIDSGNGKFLKVIGKGGKERLVPIGSHAITSIENYINHSRNYYNVLGEDWLFPSTKARKNKQNYLTRQQIYYLITKAGEEAGVEITPHRLRHTFATHLLENKADLRSVQLMLGHSDLATTEIYTKVTQKNKREEVAKNLPILQEFE